MIIDIVSKQEFLNELKTDKPVLVDFYATWCGPCKLQAPVLHEFAEEMGDKVKILKVDVDGVQEIAFDYQIMSIPTIMVFKNSNPVE
ncbi:MAG: thioredoxin, partial [Clostridia bacterium]|nr:thioredoxin [Clostridia bacterium]